MNQKVSSTILKELMAIAGGDPWKAHVEHARRTGLPIVPGEELREQVEPQSKKRVPNLDEYLKANPHKVQEERRKETQTPKQKQVNSSETIQAEQPAASTTPSSQASSGMTN